MSSPSDIPKLDKDTTVYLQDIDSHWNDLTTRGYSTRERSVTTGPLQPPRTQHLLTEYFGPDAIDAPASNAMSNNPSPTHAETDKEHMHQLPYGIQYDQGDSHTVNPHSPHRAMLSDPATSYLPPSPLFVFIPHEDTTSTTADTDLFNSYVNIPSESNNTADTLQPSTTAVLTSPSQPENSHRGLTVEGAIQFLSGNGYSCCSNSAVDVALQMNSNDETTIIINGDSTGAKGKKNRRRSSKEGIVPQRITIGCKKYNIQLISCACNEPTPGGPLKIYINNADDSDM